MRIGRRDPETKSTVYSYEMCPIREHDALIKQVEVHGHFIISLDMDGNITLSYISYEDQEEYKGYKIEEFAGRNVIRFDYSKSDNTLLVIENKDTSVNLCLYQICIDEDTETAVVGSTVYSGEIPISVDKDCIAAVFGKFLVLSPDFRFTHPSES